MRRLKFVALFAAFLIVAFCSIKGCQMVIRTPSLNSADPTERVEAAWQAIKKYGGKK